MATKTTSKTTTKTKTTPKATSAGRRKSANKTTSTHTKSPSVPPVKPASAPAPDVTAKSPTVAAEAMRRPDLIEAIANRVSLKRSEAKMVFDVVLDEIGKALDANEEVVVPPLGKLMVKKRLEKPRGQMLTLKLKRAPADPTVGDVVPLAKAGEEG